MKKSISLLLFVSLFFISGCSLKNRPADESGNNFPFHLSSEQVQQSLAQGQEIIITPVESDWPTEINDSLLKDDWQLIGLAQANDGGSATYYYFKTKTDPALSIRYRWDMGQGNYQSLNLNFISPEKIGAWLTENKAYFNEGINIESLK